MDSEKIESTLGDHSEKLIRLEERIRVLDGINDRVSRLNNYLQICAVVCWFSELVVDFLSPSLLTHKEKSAN